MSAIRNTPQFNNPILRAIRGTLEHRALWLFLLLDEAEKSGFADDRFARAAILRCGCFQGARLRADAGGASLKGLKKKLFTLPARLVFEMKVRACTDDRLDVDFHYCPLVAAWQAQGASDELIARLCDIVMEGDRGIAGSFGCKLELGTTIAKGFPACQIRFSRL